MPPFGRLDVDAEHAGNGVVFEQEGERLGVRVRLVHRDDLDADAGSRSSRTRSKDRPIRPKPLMPTRTVMVPPSRRSSSS